MHSLKDSGSEDDLIFKIIVKSDAEIHVPASRKKQDTAAWVCS